MVQIPTKFSTNKLTTQTTAPEARDISSFDRTGAGIVEAGNALKGVADEFRRLEILREATRATTDVNTALMEKEDEFLNDPNLTQKSSLDYHKWAEDYINERIGQISDEDTRLRLGVQFRGTALQRSFNVRSAGRQNDINNENVETAELEKLGLKEAWAGTPEQAEFTKENMKSHYNQRIIAKTMTTAQASKAIYDWEESYKKGKPMFDLDRDIQTYGSAGAEVFINSVMNHHYSWLTTKEENDLISEAQQRLTAEKKLEDWKLEKAQEQVLDQLIPELVKPESGLSNTDLDLMVLNRQLDPKDLEVAKRVLNSKLGVGVEPNPFVLNSIIDKKLGLVLNPQTGKRYTGLELRREVLNNVQNLGQDKSISLLDEIGKIDDSLEEQYKKNGLQRIKVFALENIYGQYTEETLQGTAKAKGENLVAQFNEQVLKEHAKGERVYAIADEIINAYKQKRDPSFKPEDHKGKKTELYNEMETILNPATGEQRMMIGGQWVTTIPPSRAQ